MSAFPISAPKSNSTNGPDAIAAPGQVAVVSRVVTRRGGAWVMGRNGAAKKSGRRILPREFYPQRTDRRETAAWFARVIAPFRTGDIAKISGASKEAVKQWKNGKSTPRLDHVLNIGRVLESVANDVEDEMRRPVDPRTISHLLALQQQIAATETGERAAIAKQKLADVAQLLRARE